MTVNLKVKDLVTTSLLIAIVFIATNINFKLPIAINNGGLVHLGMAMNILAAILYGKRKGAIAGAFGMGLFDLLSPYVMWSPFTFIIHFAIGYIVGVIAYKRNNIFYSLLAVFAAGILKVGGYYIAEIILYRNIFSPITSIPGNVTQVVVGAAIAIPLSIAIRRHNVFRAV